MEDWCKIINSEKYDVVTGWLQADCLNYLLKRGYNVEIILVDAGNNESVYKKEVKREVIMSNVGKTCVTLMIKT